MALGLYNENKSLKKQGKVCIWSDLFPKMEEEEKIF